MKLDLPALLKIALRLAVMLGARELAAGILRKHAADLRKRYKGTKDKSDDLILEACAKALELAAAVSAGLPLDIVTMAIK
jgi:hypothetical protein